MRSRADQPSPDSSMTAASNSTQSGRARHPAHRARAQKPSVRGLGRWRRPMGNHLLPHRHRKAQQRRTLYLAQRRPAAHDRRSSRQPPRRTLAVELAANKPQSLTHVQGMDAYSARQASISQTLVSPTRCDGFEDTTDGIARHRWCVGFAQNTRKIVKSLAHRGPTAPPPGRSSIQAS